jgi:hypothetical protein
MVLLFSGSVLPQAPVGKEPEWGIKLFGTEKKMEHDFGTIKRGTQLVHEFKLHNVLDSVVKVTEIRSSMGPLDARIDKRELQPNERATITVKMDSSLFIGKRNAAILVQMDNGNSPVVVRLLVSATSEK